MKKLPIISLILISILISTTLVFGQWHGVKPMLGEQIDWSNTLSKGLVGYWLFNEGSGNKVFDLSGNGNTGTFQGTAPSWTSGKFGSAVLLPGTDEYIELYSFGELVAQDNITVIVGIKPTQVSSVAIIYVQNADNIYVTHDFSVSNDGRLSYDNYLPGGGVLYSNNALSVNIDYQVAFTRNGNNVIFYIDGHSNGGGTGDARDKADDVDRTLIGARFYGFEAKEKFQGLIHYVMVYNRALSASEIAELYREPFRMFKKDDIILMAKAAEAPPSIVPTLYYYSFAPVPLIIIGYCFIIGRKNE